MPPRTWPKIPVPVIHGTCLSLPVFQLLSLSQGSEVMEPWSATSAVTVYSGHTALNQAPVVLGRRLVYVLGP